jgi:hypothetical protein
MFKFLIASFFVLAVAAPAPAKAQDIFPISCNDLWAGVKDTLDNPRNYGVMWTDDARQKVWFVVVGDLGQFTEKVALRAKDGGCAMKADLLELGPSNDDWRQFHHRLVRSLAKLKAAKPKPAGAATFQQ